MSEDVPGYRVLEKVGEGGFSVVYRAYQERLDRPVALKVLSISAVDDSAMRRFQRECKITGRLTGHPNIVTVLDTGTTRSHRPYIAMEYFERGALTDRLKHEGPLPVPEVLRIGVKMAGALAATHETDVLHRDVKPQNILVSRYGEPALADFGIARLVDSFDSTHTQAFTPHHAAPEVLEGRQPGVGSDIYSLGSTLYQLLAGLPAFKGPTGEGIAQLMLRILHDPPPPVRREDMPPPVFDAINTAMAKAPEGRFPDGVAFARRLQQVQAELGLPVTDLAHSSAGTAPTAAQPSFPAPTSQLSFPSMSAAPTAPPEAPPAPASATAPAPAPEVSPWAPNAAPGGFPPLPEPPPVQQPSVQQPSVQPPPVQQPPSVQQPPAQPPSVQQPPSVRQPPAQPPFAQQYEVRAPTLYQSTASAPPLIPPVEQRAETAIDPREPGSTQPRPAKGANRGLLVALGVALAGGLALGIAGFVIFGGDEAGKDPPQQTQQSPTKALGGGGSPNAGDERRFTPAQIRAAAPRAVRTISDTRTAVSLQWRLPAVSRKLPIVVQHAPAGNNPIVSAGNGGVNTAVGGLDPRSGYCFRVGAVLRAGTPQDPKATIAWSAPHCVRGARVGQ